MVYGKKCSSMITGLGTEAGSSTNVLKQMSVIPNWACLFPRRLPNIPALGVPTNNEQTIVYFSLIGQGAIEMFWGSPVQISTSLTSVKIY